jgi:hypothetical protein
VLRTALPVALRVEYDRVGGKARVSAAVDDAVYDALVGAPDLPTVFARSANGGGRIRTFEGRTTWFTATPL